MCPLVRFDGNRRDISFIKRLSSMSTHTRDAKLPLLEIFQHPNVAFMMSRMT